MGIAAGDDSKAPAPPSNSRKSICSKMACRVVEGRRFGIGLNALGHLPQQVVAIVDVAHAVHPPAIRDPALTRSWSGRFPKPLQERIHPRHEFGPWARCSPTLIRPGHPCARKRIKTVLGVMRPGEARNGGA